MSLIILSTSISIVFCIHSFVSLIFSKFFIGFFILNMRYFVLSFVMGPKNSCAEMSQSFRSQKMVVLIVFSTLELV